MNRDPESGFAWDDFSVFLPVERILNERRSRRPSTELSPQAPFYLRYLA